MKTSNITITILILTLNSYTFGQNIIYRGGGNNTNIQTTYYNNDNNVLSNNSNIIQSNTFNNSRNYIQVVNQNIPNNSSRNNSNPVEQSRNANPINIQQRGGNEVMEQRGGNISQRLSEPEQTQEITRNTSIALDNEINPNVVSNRDNVVQEITEIVSEPKENKVNVGNENELNLAFSFPKLEIAKVEKVEKIKDEKEITSISKSTFEVDFSFQKKSNTAKTKKIKRSKSSRKHLYNQKVRGQKLLISKLKYIKNAKLKAKTKKPYCRVVCYKF